VLSFLFGLATLVSKLAGAYNAPGFVSIVLVVSCVGGIQLVVLGVMGQYTARIFEEVNRRPLYVVDDDVGAENEEELALAAPACDMVLLNR
jgi:hypothetical protein